MLWYQNGVPGQWMAATDAGRALFVRATDSPAWIDRVWSSLANVPGASESLDSARGNRVLGQLTSDGLFRTPPFALVTWEGALDEGPVTVRTIVRGDVSLRLATATGRIEVSGRGVSTWIEQSYSNVSAFEIDCGPDAPGDEADAFLPIVAGAVWARRLSSAAMTAATPQEVSEETIAEVTVADPGDRSEPVTPEPGISQPVAEEPVILEPVTTGPDIHEPVVPESAPGYDHLFGATMMRSVEQAAIRPIDADEVDEAPAAPTSKTIELPAFLTGPNPDTLRPASRTPAASAPTAPAPLPLDPASGDHDGLTVMSVDLKKRRVPGTDVRSAGAAPIPAAPLLSLLLPSGGREPLTQPVLVGRAPSVSKVSAGKVPRLVSVGNADQDISRNHVQFDVEGDTVVVTDLHSRNGTMISLPGKAPQKLRQGEPTAVIVGTVVDLGGGIALTVCED
jgi:hypothetical protein